MDVNLITVQLDVKIEKLDTLLNLERQLIRISILGQFWAVYLWSFNVVVDIAKYCLDFGAEQKFI